MKNGIPRQSASTLEESLTEMLHGVFCVNKVDLIYLFDSVPVLRPSQQAFLG